MIKSYSGYINNNDELLTTSSGGIATALSKVVINNNGCVFGARYSSDFYYVEYCCIDNIEDLDQIKGSKYAKAASNNCYETLSKKLAEGRTVLFIGL